MVSEVGGRVVSVPFSRDECAELVVSLLEDALAFARENPCSVVSVFLTGRDGQNYFYDGTDSRTRAVGALAMMQFQMMGGD